MEVRSFPANVGVTGLTALDFVLTLQRRSGSALVSSSETVSVQEISDGEYWVYYTPTAAVTMYLLTVAAVDVDNAVTPDHPFQTDVLAAGTITTIGAGQHALNSEVRHMVEVRSVPANNPVTGLSTGSFTLTLRRRSGGSLISSPETVAVQEIGTGKYWVYYTPTVAATLYLLSVVPTSAAQSVSPDHPFQTDVSAIVALNSGPYLTTLAAFKQAWNLNVDTWDAALTQLLPQITALFERECNEKFVSADATEYPEVRGIPLKMLRVDRAPITAIASLHISTSRPRVYDATTELVEGVDFEVREEKGRIELVSPVFLGEGTTLKAVRVVYTGGYPTVPEDVERAAQEVMGTKFEKAKAKAYHLMSDSKNDGSIGGIRFDDLTPNALRVIESHTRNLVA